jgi:mannan endo-1,4-beta-mannosidase
MTDPPRATARGIGERARGGGATFLAETQRMGRHRQVPGDRQVPVRRNFRARLAPIAAVVGSALAIVVVFAVGVGELSAQGRPSEQLREATALPTTPASYIGVYSEGAPSSYGGVTAFKNATGVSPGVVLYYSQWMEPFRASFAKDVADNGAVPLVQINPDGVSVAAIAAGKYDGYLGSYASAVRAFRRPVILSFGHEMNGYWYSWGNLNTPAPVFVAAWRHIVRLFRSQGADNVTWMWTVNTIHPRANVPNPARWWPGSSYVNWVGIDGYYATSSNTFAPLFGPTITAVRTFTRDPILIAETAAAPNTNQAAKIADLFAGVRLYGLLGFVWFDAIHTVDWRITTRSAIAAFRRGADAYGRSSP